MRTKISISILFIILLTSLLTVKGQDKKEIKQAESIVATRERDAKGDERKSLEDLQKAMQESFAVQEKALKDKYKLGMMDESDYKKATVDLMEQQLKMKELQKKFMNEDYVNQLNKISQSYVAVPGSAWTNPKGGNTVWVEGMRLQDMYNRRENNSMNISKALEDVSLSTDFQYEVKEGTNSVSFFVNGTLKAGELKITLKKPDKTAFQEIPISPLADVNWNQQFSWEEDESDAYLGKWTISISASKANGNYRVQVNSR